MLGGAAGPGEDERERAALSSAAELDDAAAVALGGSPVGHGEELLHGFALGRCAETSLLARVGFAVEGLRDGSGATTVAEGENFDFEFATLVANAEHIADADFAGGLGGLSIAKDAAEIAGAGGEGAGFKKPGGPEIFVDAERGHPIIFD